MLKMSLRGLDLQGRGNLQKTLPTLVWLLLALFVIRAFIYASFVPPWQGPDEPLHFDYVHYLQTEKKLPVLGKTVLCKKVKGSLRNFYFGTYFKGGNPYEKQQKPVIKETHRKHIKHGEEGFQNQIVQHPPFYYLVAAVFSYPFKNASLLTNIWLLRILSAAFGLGVVILTFLTVDLVFESNKWPAIAATAFVATNPMFTHITTLVTNDSLVNFLFALFIFGLVKIIKNGFTTKRSLFIGIVIGLGLLTKFFFVLAIPMTLAAWLLFRKQLQVNWKKILYGLTSMVTISSLYYLRNIKLYATLQPVFKTYKVKGPLKEVSLTKFPFLFSHKLFISFWSNFGWQQPRFSKSWHIIIFIAVLFGLFGVLGYLFSLYRSKNFQKLKIATLLLTAILTFALMLIINSYQIFRLTQIIQGVQGRYFFIFIGPLGLLFYLGIRQWLPFKKGKAAFVALLTFMVAMDISAIFYYILPYFYGLDSGVLSVMFEASNRASRDWFRLGYLYVTSLLAYVLLIVGVIGVSINEKVKST